MSQKTAPLESKSNRSFWNHLLHRYRIAFGFIVTFSLVAGKLALVTDSWGQLNPSRNDTDKKWIAPRSARLQKNAAKMMQWCDPSLSSAEQSRRCTRVQGRVSRLGGVDAVKTVNRLSRIEAVRRRFMIEDANTSGFKDTETGKRIHGDNGVNTYGDP